VHASDAATRGAGIRHSGFTLVEVLAALVIVSLGMLGVIEAVSQTANSGAYLREKTVAHWVAMNRLTEVRLENQQPDIGKSDDEVEMAGRRWRWNMEVTQTPVESMRRIDIEVALADAPKDSSLASVTGFYGTAVDQPGTAGSIWPGGAAGGPGGPGGGGGDTGDPNNPPDPNNPQNPAPGTDPPPTEPDPVPPPTPEQPEPDPGT
jgi:general secretion pathway protein I